MNKIEELILDFVDAWGFKLSGKNIDEDMLLEEKNKNMTKDLKGIINSAVKEQKAVLKKYEEWEAKLIMEDNCWENGLPELTQELFEEFLEIQELRNQAIREQ